MNAVGSPAIGTTTIRASPIVTPGRQGVPQPTMVHRSASWVSGRGLGGARGPQHYPGRGGGGSPASNGGYGGGVGPRSADGYSGGLPAASPPQYGPGQHQQEISPQGGGGGQGQMPQHLMNPGAAYIKAQTPSPRYGPIDGAGAAAGGGWPDQQQQYQEQQYQDAYNYPPDNLYAGQQGYAIPQGYAAQTAAQATQAMPPPSPVAHHQQQQQSSAEQGQMEPYSQQSQAYQSWGEMRDVVTDAFQKPLQAAKAAAKRISPSGMIGGGGVGGAGGSVSSSGNQNVAFGRHFQPVPPRSRTGTGERSEMSLSGFSSVGGSENVASLDMSILAASAVGGTMASSGKKSKGSSKGAHTTPWAMMKRRQFVDGQLLPPNKVKGWGRGAAHAADSDLKLSDKSSSTSKGGPPSLFAGSDISELSMTLSISNTTKGSSVKSPHGGSLRRTLSMPGMRQSDLMSLGDASFDALLEEAALSGVGGAGAHVNQPVIGMPGADAPVYVPGSKLSLGSSSSSGDKKSLGGGVGGGASSKASSANSGQSGGGGSATRMSPLSETSSGGHRFKQGQGPDPVMISGTSTTAMGAPFHPVNSALLQSSITGGPAMSSLPPQQRAQRIRSQTDGSTGGRSSAGRSSGGRSMRSRESGGWVDTFQSMTSVGSDMYTWNEEESRASMLSEISADLMALDLADTGGSLCLLPSLGPGRGGEGHASEDTMEVANT
uniref:Uncharacterized protein n=1 Tax=Odontella aurita TaxID=265563 RepID=A0A6U6L805_9STRA|mmetsp:Transcript_6852/g.20442  ORF Transcript_6852/g.20442 Transcript_6852/m.20442 type:complete len:714 (+) Transcript_6852:727-2868(+)